MYRFSIQICLMALLPFALQGEERKTKDEAILSLFNLEGVEIVSVSKKKENSFDAPSAVFVISQDDIKRSGATSIPEVLRLAPGLEVAQIDSNKWAISSRGFNRQFANKMLVLIDGRAVYTPLFSGTMWDAQDVVLDDIYRIEVIRGPGGTLWGSNAVNGVINIITKDSSLTQGHYTSLTTGNHAQTIASYRYGGKLGHRQHYRFYGKYRNFDNSSLLSGADADDAWQMGSAGFRFDSRQTSKNHYVIQGDIYNGTADAAPVGIPASLSTQSNQDDALGGNIMAKWNYALSPKGTVNMQAYIDYDERDFPALHQKRLTFDVEAQYSHDFNKRNEMIVGAGYRLFKDTLTSRPINGELLLDYTPNESYNHLYNIFVQHKYGIIPDKLYITTGTKLEHNYFTDTEIQPNMRLAWHPSFDSTVWGGVSRSVRIPSRAERTIELVAAGTSPNFIRQVGNPDFESEEMIAYEMGYRFRPQKTVKVDMTAFYNDYDNLRSFEPNGSVNIPVDNNAYGDVFGGEVLLEWSVQPNWQLIASYSYLEMQLHVNEGSSDIFSEADEERSPNHQVTLRSHVNLPNDWEWDMIAYYTDELSDFGIDDYVRLDARIGWNPIKDMNISITGQNLLDDTHQEFAGVGLSAATQVERSVHATVTFKF